MLSKPIMINVNGELVPAIRYCEQLGLSYYSVRVYKRKHNITLEEAIEHYLTGKARLINKIDCDGEMVSMAEYCKRKNLNYSSITDYMYTHGLSFEQAVYEYTTKRKTKDKRLRRIWKQMINRCYNPKSSNYDRYGGRGITVQESWHDYFNFEDDMYSSYIKHCEEFGVKQTSIERNDYDGNYCVENCRWATPKEQANNTSRNFMVTENLTLTQFSEIYGISCETIKQRLNSGWSVEKIINIPVKPCNIKHYLPCNNNTKPLVVHCRKNGYNYKLILSYIKKYNLSPQEALARYLKNRQKKKD